MNEIHDKSILVVDDEQDLRVMIKSIFERAGYTQVITAASAQEALKILSKKMPEIIILDVMMPGMDGFELLQEIRAVSKVPPNADCKRGSRRPFFRF